MSDNVKLKQWCIVKALGVEGSNPIELAQDIYQFLLEGESTLVESIDTPVEPIKPLETVTVVVDVELTRSERRVMTHLVHLYLNGIKYTGQSIGKDINLAQSQVSKNLRNLAKKGFTRKEGSLFVPLKDAKGQSLPTRIHKVPTGYAKGYTPLTAPLGKIARIHS